MPFYTFFWTPDRIDKLDQHGIDPDDFEAIVSNPASTGVSRSSGRPMAFGCDDAGNEIVCIYEVGSDGLTVYPITAYYTED